ncbi:MAG: glycosyltransferase, partial [Cyanobacteria bacterium P01_C01_bin.73]
GARPVAEVKALDGLPGVTVTGRVPSITDYLHQSTLCVVPLRVGLGIKTKTLESMASGIPIVASDRGLEGLTVDEAGIPLRALRANTPQAFVDTIGRLFEHPELRTELSRNARAMIEADYTWERAGEKYERVLAAPNR